MGILDDLDKKDPGAQAPVPPAAPAQAVAPQQQARPAGVLDQLDMQSPAQAQTQAQPSGDIVDIADVGHSALSSVPKGLIAGAGTLGDVSHALSAGTDYAGSALGATPEQIEKFKDVAGHVASAALPGAAAVLPLMMRHAPTSGEIRKAVEEKSGPLYEPQTSAGKFTGAVGETLSNPLTYMGSGSALLKIMMGIGSGLGGEAGRELGEKVGFGTTGSIAGSVLGSALARRTGMIGSNPATPPTRADLRAVADNQYDAARKLGVVFDPNSMNSIATDIKDHLYTTRGFRPMKDLGRQTFKLMDELLDPNKFVYTVDDVKSVRTALGNVAKANVIKNNPERAAAIEAINMIDDRMAGLAPKDVTANASKLPALKELMENAKGNYAASMRSMTLDDLMERAKRRTAATGAGTNIDNVTRQTVNSVINNPKKRMQYTTQEIDAMKDIVNGNFTRNLGRYTGKFSPSGIVSATLGSALGRAIAGPIGEFLGPAVGYGAKKLADRATMRAVQRLGEATRARSPLYTSQHGAYTVPIRPSIMPSVYSNIQNRQQEQE